MKFIFLINSLLFLIQLFAFGQSGFNIRNSSGELIEERKVDLSQACNQDSIYLFVTKEPTYKPGMDALEETLNNELQFDKKLRYSAHLMFLINCEGQASGFIHTDRENSEYIEKVIAILDESQEWDSAKIGNRNVDRYMHMILVLKQGKVKIK
ncbi:hypothetical protein AAG747_13000 [Rapidithrix thailandica]|uniref:Uncharacterized protein n=1 Tax=Rapidithrix thailandica TaxID=413964 RepID=A0AAW9RVA9_9BACT